MKSRYGAILAGGLLACMGAAWGQGAPPGGGQSQGSAFTVPKETMLTRDTISADEVRQLATYLDTQQISVRKDQVTPRIARDRMVKALKALKVQCQISEAAQVLEIFGKHWGHDASVGVYEVACDGGTGYRVTLRDGGETSAQSCYALDPREDAHAATGDATAKALASGHCSLAGNADPRTRASALMAALGTPCQATDARWLGENPTEHLEYIEVRCADEKGFVAHLPVPGASAERGVLDCPQSGAKGIACTLTFVPGAVKVPSALQPKRPDVAWLRQQLATAGVACDLQQSRYIGQEARKRRWVVEFDCKDRPEGLVAFIPSDETTDAAFESMDCAAATTRGASCHYHAQ